MTLAQTIKQARVGKYTQKEVADAVGLAQPSYARIENGLCTPNINNLFKIARLLGIDLNRFVAEVDVLPYYRSIEASRALVARNRQQRSMNEAG